MKILNLEEHVEAMKCSNKGGHVNNDSSTPSTAVYCCHLLLRFVTATTHNQHTYPQNKQAYCHLLAELMITDNTHTSTHKNRTQDSELMITDNIHTSTHKNRTQDSLQSAIHSQLN